MLQKVFVIGNSVAVTLPRKWGVSPGTRVRGLHRRRNRLSYEIMGNETVVSPSRAKSDYLKKVSGAIKSNMSTDRVMETIRYLKDHPYEKI